MTREATKKRLHEIIKNLKDLNYTKDANIVAYMANQRIAQFFAGYTGPVFTGPAFTGSTCDCVTNPQFYKIGCRNITDLIIRQCPQIGTPRSNTDPGGWVLTYNCGPNCCPDQLKVGSISSSFPDVNIISQKLTAGKGFAYSDDQCWRLTGRAIQKGRTTVWKVVEIRYLGIPCGNRGFTGPTGPTPQYNPANPLGLPKATIQY